MPTTGGHCELYGHGGRQLMRLLGQAAAAPHLDHLTAARPAKAAARFVTGAAGTPDGHSLSRM